MVANAFLASRQCVSGESEPSFATQFVDDRRVIGGRRHHRDILIILRRRANHGGSADVDVLDQFLERRVLLRGDLFELVEIHADQIDRRDSVLLQIARMCSGLERIARMPAGDARMNGLHPAVEHFRESGDFGDFAQGSDSGFFQDAKGPAGGNNLDAQRREGAREIDNAGLVGDAQQSAMNAGHELTIVPRHARDGDIRVLSKVMRLVTFRRAGATPEAGIVNRKIKSRGWATDMLSVIAAGKAPVATGPTYDLAAVKLLAPIPRPPKLICVGLNYRDHAAETKNEIPTVPTIFSKFPNVVIGPGEPIVLPKISSKPDYEAEFAFVIGPGGRNIPASQRDASTSSDTPS